VGEAGQDNEVTYNAHKMCSMQGDGTTGRSDSRHRAHPLRSLTSVGRRLLATLRHIRSSVRRPGVATWATRIFPKKNPLFSSSRVPKMT